LYSGILLTGSLPGACANILCAVQQQEHTKRLDFAAKHHTRKLILLCIICHYFNEV